jgi:hypothetical protein
MTNESDIYVEIQQKSFFNRSIILSSNLIDLSHYKVTRKNHEILIFSGKEEVARTPLCQTSCRLQNLEIKPKIRGSNVLNVFFRI